MGWGLLLLLVLLPGQPVVPASPNSILGGSCEGVECGRGKCQTGGGGFFGYSCECDSGWTKLGRGDGLLGDLPFFPCVIPDCTFKASCSDDTPAAAPPPLPPSLPTTGNLCALGFCGNADCEVPPNGGFRCNCRPGYANFLNITALPCVKECYIEANCADLGSTPASTPPPAPLSDSANKAAAPSPVGVALILLISSLLLATRT